MELGRTLAGLDELRRGFFVQLFLTGAVGGDRKHVQITQLPGFLRPERLQRVRGIRPALRKKVAQPQQMPGLQRIRLIAHARIQKVE